MQNPTHPGKDPTAYPPPVPIGVRRQGVNVAAREGLGLLGCALVLLAVPAAFLTPNLPVGLPMIVSGVVLAGVNGVWVRRWANDLLARHPRWERGLPPLVVHLALGRAKRDFNAPPP